MSERVLEKWIFREEFRWQNGMEGRENEEKQIEIEFHS